MLNAQEPTRPGWIETSTGLSYPPEPWFLGGTLAGSVFRAPVSALPASVRTHIPPDHRLVTLAGQVLVAVCFVHYAAGGVLSYEELLVAVPVRRGLRVRCSVVQIWVDSAVSATGGRALWSIPKQLASFDRWRDGPSVGAEMRDGSGEVAALSARVRGPLLPGHWQFPLTTAQRLEGRDVVASNSIIGRLRRTRAHWRFAEHGPLSWMNQAHVCMDLMVDDAIVAFGQQVARP
jgi:Acetoacetate decarboxylase (ADC)